MAKSKFVALNLFEPLPVPPADQPGDHQDEDDIEPNPEDRRLTQSGMPTKGTKY